MKRFEIWIGYYHLGQGYEGSNEPELIAKETAIDFKTACLKYELKSKLRRIEEGERIGNLNSQDYPWWFNENDVSNSWLGKYYETREDALSSFSFLINPPK